MATSMAMDKLAGAQPAPLVVTRLFPAAPELVFKELGRACAPMVLSGRLQRTRG
jgi:hypothetical protein